MGVRARPSPRGKARQGPVEKRGVPARAAKKPALPLTTSRPELLPDGTDREFRQLVHNLFAFMARHEAIRDGLAHYIGLPGVDYTILISIGHLALDGDVNVKTVADHLHMSGAFVTTVTSKLQAQGLIEKTQDTGDRRRMTLAITDAGMELLRRLAPFQRETNDAEFSCLSREQFQFLSTILEALIASSDRAMALQRYKAEVSAKAE